MCHVVKTSSWLVCCKKKLKNIILTGNLTWNWCLSFGICQYYSRNMFHCRASWDYDPFTQLVRIPQIHSTVPYLLLFGNLGPPHRSRITVYIVFLFSLRPRPEFDPRKGWWQIRPDKSVLGRNGTYNNVIPVGQWSWCSFVDFFLSQHGASNEVCHESWKLIERPLSYARFEFLPIKRGTKWKGPALVQPISSTASGV